MKCPNCGAEVKGMFCEYCGSEMPNEKSTVYIINNYYGEGGESEMTVKPRPRKKTWLWVLGWICIFPLPLTILLLRKKDMKPVIKYGFIALAWVLFFVIGMTGNTENDVSESVESNQTAEDTSKIEENSEMSGNPIEAESIEVILNNYIEDVISKYNAQATEQLVFVEDFIPSDAESAHYRTEFRLAAYEEAVGKSYILEDKVVDIVASQDIFDEIHCRIYSNNTSFEQVVALLNGFSPILDEELVTDELQMMLDEITTKRTANGYYFGKLGITLFGSDDKGYELMLKND